MNKTIERRLRIEAQKQYPFDVIEELYGHTRHIGRYDENEAFKKGAKFMFDLLLDQSCEWWGQFQYNTENYKKDMKGE